MIDTSKQYTYKNGEAARILCTDRPFTGNLVVLSMRPNGAVIQSTIDGKSQCYNGEYDLVEAWEPKEGELCYFWDNGDMNHITVSKFVSMKSQRYESLVCSSPYDNCAKFTGTLPEAFKGLV